MSELVFSVIIPTHNRSDALRLTLEHLSRQKFDGGWEVIVINNNSTDDTDKVVTEMIPSFPVSLKLLQETKPGAAAARNKGANAAVGQYLVFIDNDILTPPGFLQKHFDRHREYPEDWIIGPTFNLPDLEKTPFGKCLKAMTNYFYSGFQETNIMTGANTSLPRHQFMSLNGFDENFDVASGEDRELAMRALKNGIKIYADAEISAIHNDWAGGTIRDYCLRQKLYTRTEPLFWRKYRNDTPRMQLVLENTPPKLRRDGLRLYLWKHTKKMLGSNGGQKVLLGISSFLEKRLPGKFLLWRIYRLAIAGSIYRGFNEGLKQFNVNPDEMFGKK